jgi:hypothetical protein
MMATQPNFMIREHTCVECGQYIWAHPTGDCSMSVAEAQAAYDRQVEVNRASIGRPGGQ